ncbi:KTSC domain-containing protein [Halobacterium salinarum]|uniref:KTSC domain-containing protein n=1 Tax=Halobacterium salinarum TaxID=2242 RepID=UPI0025535937|nr:KTSC domain-containing protein [Halobacterium salinarum]MDL0126658.1 KTSC domain-containing protein [Halobacterium salinarum]
MDRESVSSSLLDSVGYDPDEQVLEVELQDGSVYQYIDVPEETYRGLMDADSLGRYFNAHIRGHSYHRIR